MTAPVPHSSPAAADTAMQYFVCIGAQKAGTSWLHRALHGQFGIAMSPLKELHFFDHLPFDGQVGEESPEKLFDRISKALEAGPRALARSGRPSPDELFRMECCARRLRMRSPADYRRYFERVGERAGATIVGESTPAYATLSAAGFKLIVDTFPRARFVFVLRNPAERLWSHARFKARITGSEEPTKDFPAFIDTPAAAARARYDHTISRLREVAGVDAIFIGFYERMVDPLVGDDEFSRLASFLVGQTVRGQPAIPREQVMLASPPAPLPPDSRRAAVERYRDVYEYVEALTKSAALPPLPPNWVRDMTP